MYSLMEHLENIIVIPVGFIWISLNISHEFTAEQLGDSTNGKRPRTAYTSSQLVELEKVVSVTINTK